MKKPLMDDMKERDEAKRRKKLKAILESQKPFERVYVNLWSYFEVPAN